jgi:hypothetical protein
MREHLKRKLSLITKQHIENAAKQTSIIDSTVQFNDDSTSMDLVDELRQCFFAGHDETLLI